MNKGASATIVNLHLKKPLPRAFLDAVSKTVCFSNDTVIR